MNTGNSAVSTRPVYAELGNFISTRYQESYDYELSQSTVATDSCVGSQLPVLQNMLSQVDEKPKILLMGLRRSGKSSIQRVVFHKMAPNETLFLESTHKIEKNDVSECSFIKFQIWDFPGHIDFCDETFQSEAIFLASCAIIFIIDAQPCPLILTLLLPPLLWDLLRQFNLYLLIKAWQLELIVRIYQFLRCD
ncbi:hypothetical protein MN116_000219 [Schistosoma mekongi]|uniref:Ras-related GTP-binding protein n=1 Tax=Schistosoma mekongi TaxID=38744 RepID=A0AAE1Z6B2_SCHME|nr:hypothetical protein MN116_000219 [Schistosoma mekongi]